MPDEAGKLGMVLVHNGGRDVIDFDLCSGRDCINGVAEGVDGKRKQDRVGADAVQLLQAQRKNVEQFPSISGFLFPENEGRRTDKEDGEDRQRDEVGPEFGKAEALREGADADLLEP